MRVVIDPNVLVAAAVADGVSARLLDHWFTSRSFEIVVCPMLMAELGDVLGRDKFRRWVAEEDVALLLARLEQESETWSDPSERETLDEANDEADALSVANGGQTKGARSRKDLRQPTTGGGRGPGLVPRLGGKGRHEHVGAPGEAPLGINLDDFAVIHTRQATPTIWQARPPN